jgi:hypothetical protein
MFAATSSRCASVRERFAELQQVLSQTPEARETGKAVGVESKLEALRLAIGNLEPARGAAEGPSAETAKAVQDSVKVNA